MRDEATDRDPFGDRLVYYGIVRAGQRDNASQCEVIVFANAAHNAAPRAIPGMSCLRLPRATRDNRSSHKIRTKRYRASPHAVTVVEHRRFHAAKGRFMHDIEAVDRR